MTGTIIDCFAIALGTTIGTIANSKLKKGNISEKVMQTLALCAFLVGITGCLDVSNPIVAIISLVAGGLIGNAIQLEKWVVWLLNKSSSILSKTPISEKSVEGFVSYSLLSIVGSMAIVGAIQNGLNGDITTLLTKSVLDMICAILFGASFGMSILFSVAIVFVYQGFFSCLAVMLSPVITTAVLGDMSAVGSVLIFCVGLNLLGICNYKTMNLVPAIFLPIFIYQFL
mgnify:CR=1 FL=1